MKITTKNYGEITNYDSIEEYAESKLSGEDYDRGAIEAAEAMGRLMDVLAEKGILDAEDVGKIVDDFPSEIKFGEVL